jgi:hypothetical protein
MINELHDNDFIDTSREHTKTRIDFLDQREKKLTDILQSGKDKEEVLRKKLLALQQKLGITPEEKKIIQENFEDKTPQEIEKIVVEKKHNPKMRKLIKIATVLWIAGILLMVGWQKILEAKSKKSDSKETNKEIVVSDESKKIQTITNADTLVVELNTKKPIIKEKTEIPVIKKERISPIKKKMITPKNTWEDEVFTMIDHDPNPNIDPERYSSWKELSEPEKNTVKETYETLLQTNNHQELQRIINTLDKRILHGLRDILVKKIILVKKAGKEAERYQSIAQMTIDRENEMVTQKV